MTTKQKKSLYESIMKTVAKTVKDALMETKKETKKETKLNESFEDVDQRRMVRACVKHNIAISSLCDCAVGNVAIQRAGKRRYNCDVFVDYGNNSYNADIITREYVNRGIPSFTVNPDSIDDSVELIGFYYINDEENYEQNVHFVKVTDLADALLSNKFRRYENANITAPIYVINDGWILSHSIFTVDVA